MTTLVRSALKHLAAPIRSTIDAWNHDRRRAQLEEERQRMVDLAHG